MSGTNDPLKTFADVNETIENTHPVLLSGSGRVPNIFFSEAAKEILTNADETQFWERDPVTTGGSSGSQRSDWDAITIYSELDEVNIGGALYASFVNNNQNNNPSTSPESWTQFDLLKRWNTNESYSIGDPVTQNGFVYISSVDNNLANDPATDLAGNWSGFSGALVGQTAPVGIPNSTVTAVVFDDETYDTNSFHDNAVNNTRITIPAGVERVRLIGQVKCTLPGATEYAVGILKNGSTPVASNHTEPSAVSSSSIATPVIVVTAGDYFELTALQNSGGVATTTIVDTFFSIEVIR